MSTRHPYRKITFATKKRIIDDAEDKKMSKSQLMTKYNLKRSTLDSILARADAIKSQSFIKGSSKKCRIKPAKFPELEKRLMAEFHTARNTGKINISGTFLIEKARQIATELQIENFQFSSGWFTNFKTRNRITCVTSCGESAKVDLSDIDAWLEANQSTLKSFNPNDVYNLDETGLFFRMQPKRTLAIRGEQCHGGKVSKDRVTIMLCTNMNGTDKHPLLAIGRANKPRCFPDNFKRDQSTFSYRNNRKAWMQTDIFVEWLQRFDEQMSKLKRNVLLLMDNFAGHSTEALNLTSVTVLFFPANCTSIVQPLDAGIISNFKHHYKRLLLNDYWGQIQAGNEIQEINLLQAINYSVQAWDQVQSKTIENCFRKALPSVFPAPKSEISQESSGFEINPRILDHFFNKAFSFDDFVSADSRVEIGDSFQLGLAINDSDEDTIIDGDIEEAKMEPDLANSDEDDDDEEEAIEARVKPKEAFAALNTLLRFSAQKGQADENSFLAKYLDRVIEQTNYDKKQDSILNYFSKSSKNVN